MIITLYTTHCPKCKVLETKLEQKGLEYLEVTDVELMKELGFLEVPILRVDNEYMSFTKAVQWLNSR